MGVEDSGVIENERKREIERERERERQRERDGGSVWFVWFLNVLVNN